MIGATAPIDLAASGEVELRNIEALELVRVERRRGAQLSKNRHHIAFIWQCDDDEWQTNVELIDSLIQDGGGHQYLTGAGVDDASIEVSFGEAGVLIPGT